MIDRQSLTQLRNQVQQLLDDLPEKPRNKTNDDLKRGACRLLAALNRALGDGGERTDKRVYPISKERVENDTY